MGEQAYRCDVSLWQFLRRIIDNVPNDCAAVQKWPFFYPDYVVSSWSSVNDEDGLLVIPAEC